MRRLTQLPLATGVSGEKTSSGFSAGIGARIDALLDGAGTARIETAGALTLVEGRRGEQPLRLALTDRSIAGGSFGVDESELLATAFVRSLQDAAPVVLALDSGGARLTAGLAGLAAFRRMYRAALELRLAGVPMAALLERNCFGGASMLAMLCGARGALQSTRIGMSGPAIVEALAGKQEVDASDRDAVRALFGAGGRADAGAIDEVFAGENLQHGMLTSLSRLAAGRHLDIQAQHQKLKKRLHDAGLATPSTSLADASQLFCRGTPVGACEIWQLAEAVLLANAAETITLPVDCPGQVASRRDELLVLSEYVAHLALCLAERCASGVEIVTRIEGECSGGIYVALAAGVTRVEAMPAASLRVLPEKAVAVVMGNAPPVETLDDALNTGVVDRLVTERNDAAQTSPRVGIGKGQ